MSLVSKFFMFSTNYLVREMTLTFLIAVDTDKSIAVGAFSKQK